ncbi:MAG: hypothetical protein U0807_08685 [Candidatus Binatia bacterium]
MARLVRSLALILLVVGAVVPRVAAARSCRQERLSALLLRYYPSASAGARHLRWFRIEREADACATLDVAALGFRHDCRFRAGDAGLGARCATLPVATPRDLAACLRCWEDTRLEEVGALLDPSHARARCGAGSGGTGLGCALLACPDPLPEAVTEAAAATDPCERVVASAPPRYLMRRSRLLGSCRDGRSACLANPERARALNAQARARNVRIRDACEGELLTPSATFCCDCARSAGTCAAAEDRDVCAARGCEVVEGSLCDAHAGRCRSAEEHVTWWSACPVADACPGPAIPTRREMIDCIETAADRVADELLCLVAPASWCPGGGLGSASAAFLDAGR